MIKVRRDTRANWAANNPTPDAGQPCYDETNKRLRVGDGVAPHESIPAIGDSIAEPTVGAAPSVYSFTNDIWIFLLELPATNGLNANNLEIKLENVGLVFTKVIRLGRKTSHMEPKLPFDVTVSYRWRNNYRIGGADGWSVFSGTSTAFALGSGTPNAAYDTVTNFDNDPSDGSLI